MTEQPTPTQPATSRLFALLHATAENYAHAGNPFDIGTQLCAVLSHTHWEAAPHIAAIGLRRVLQLPTAVGRSAAA